MHGVSASWASPSSPMKLLEDSLCLTEFATRSFFSGRTGRLTLQPHCSNAGRRLSFEEEDGMLAFTHVVRLSSERCAEERDELLHEVLAPMVGTAPHLTTLQLLQMVNGGCYLAEHFQAAFGGVPLEWVAAYAGREGAR